MENQRCALREPIESSPMKTVLLRIRLVPRRVKIFPFKALLITKVSTFIASVEAFAYTVFKLKK